MSTSICDFCSGPCVTWRYPAESFVAYEIAGVVGQSVGDWAACSICHRIIEAGDRAGLLERSIGALLERNPNIHDLEPELRALMANFHLMFFANQTGPALPVV